MTKPDPRKKVHAVLLLASGTSCRAVAAELEVSPGTLRTWRRRPGFEAAVTEVRELVAGRTLSGVALYEAVTEVLERVAPREVPQPVRMVVTVPAGASAEKRRRLIARAVGRGVARAMAQNDADR